MAKIYTKVGDQGSTSLLGGQKVLKQDFRIQAYGTVDELNSTLGWVGVEAKRQLDQASHEEGRAGARLLQSFARLFEDIQTLQNWLFDLGSLLASEEKDHAKFKLSVLRKEQIEWMETRIDEATTGMPKLSAFILPGGSELSARFQIARAVCRRAEREMVALHSETKFSPENAIPFINRLSDYLFTMARFSNFLLTVNDPIWEQGTGNKL